jgi:hypothetical protein
MNNASARLASPLDANSLRRTAPMAAEPRARLTEAQRRALRWIDENPHTKSSWVSGWTVLELSGPTGSIRIPEADTKALLPFIGIGRNDRIHDVNEAGRRALVQEASNAEG